MLKTTYESPHSANGKMDYFASFMLFDYMIAPFKL